MYKHHEESIHNMVEYFQRESDVKALLLGGSIAHGYEGATSDIDVMIIVSDKDYETRLSQGLLHYFNRELCTYTDGYVDGKYLGENYLHHVGEKGSEPARFAFQDVRVLIGGEADLEKRLERITRYPVEGKAERMRHFFAQFEAWNWYASEALRLNNRYLLGISISRLVLFGGRMILTHNELLYPYHKWFLRVLARAQEKPKNLLTSIDNLYEETSTENVRKFYELIKGYRAWEGQGMDWPAQFMLDSELNWQTDKQPIDDW